MKEKFCDRNMAGRQKSDLKLDLNNPRPFADLARRIAEEEEWFPDVGSSNTERGGGDKAAGKGVAEPVMDWMVEYSNLNNDAQASRPPPTKFVASWSSEDSDDSCSGQFDYYGGIPRIKATRTWRPIQSSGPTTSTSSAVLKPKAKLPNQIRGWFPKYGERKALQRDPSNTSNAQTKRQERYMAHKKIISESRGQKRPQDIHPHFAKRMRLINLGEAKYPDPPKSKINELKLEDEDFNCRSNWKLYEKTGSPCPKWIQKPDELRHLVQILQTLREFAIDAEGHDIETRGKTGFCALMQISTWEHGDFLVDPTALNKEISEELKQVLEDETITKIMYGCTNDVLMFRRDFMVALVRVIDVQKLYQCVNGGLLVSLENVSKMFYPEHEELLSVKETFSDWRARGDKFTKSQEVYATNDCHVLLRVYDQMRSICLDHGEDGKDMLKLAFDLTKAECNRELLLAAANDGTPLTWTKEAKSDLRRNPDFARKLDNFNAIQNERFENIVHWRHKFGNYVDLKDAELLSNVMVMKIAKYNPCNAQALKAILGPSFTEYIEKQGKVILKILETGKEHLKKLEDTKCYNCKRKGHVAKFCAQPEMKQTFYKEPGNELLRKNLLKRKREARKQRERERKKKDQEERFEKLRRKEEEKKAPQEKVPSTFTSQGRRIVPSRKNTEPNLQGRGQQSNVYGCQHDGHKYERRY